MANIKIKIDAPDTITAVITKEAVKDLELEKNEKLLLNLQKSWLEKKNDKYHSYSFLNYFNSISSYSLKNSLVFINK
jgi:hypothetical protein